MVSKALLVLPPLMVSCGGAGLEEEEGVGDADGEALLGVAEEEAGACEGVAEPWAGVGDAESAISSAMWKAQALGSGRLFWAAGRAVAKTARKRHRAKTERLKRAILDCCWSCSEANVNSKIGQAYSQV